MLEIAIILFGYLMGSIPFAIIVTRAIKGIDVRDGGSGHSGATNTLRQAGWAAGVLVLVLDILKGFIPAYLALKFIPDSWAFPIAAGIAVVGHCWPIFADFRGGMGLAASAGVLLAIYPPGVLWALTVLISLTLLTKHSARASVATGILLPILLILIGVEKYIILTSLVFAFAIILRFYTDWNREYKEVWLDREPGSEVTNSD